MRTRTVVALCGLLLTALSASASENWFLPYTPDEHTLLLLHFDAKGEQEANAASPADAKSAGLAFTLVGGATREAGVFGGGIRFDGVKASLRGAGDAPLRFRDDQDFTVEMWLRPAPGAMATLVSLGARFYVALDVEKQLGEFTHRSAANLLSSNRFAKVPVQANQWQHLACVHHRNRMVQIYVNGVLAGEAMHAAEGALEKGVGAHFGSYDGWKSFFAGRMDEIRVSDCAREYQPLLPRRLAPKDRVGLAVDVGRLPRNVEQVRVRVSTDAGKSLCDRTVSRNELSGDLFPATELPAGKHKVEVVFADSSGAVLSQVLSTLDRVSGSGGDRESDRDVPRKLDAVEVACRKASAGVTPERLRSAEAMAASARQCLARRDLETAGTRADAAARIAQAMQTGEAAYRAAVRKLVRGSRSPRDVRVTLSWYGNQPERAAEGLVWAKRLGANEIVCFDLRATPQAPATWKKGGCATAMLSNLAMGDPQWLRTHPEYGQFGYWLSDLVTATADVVEIPLSVPQWGDARYQLCTRFDPKRYWKIVAISGRETVAVDTWEFDAEARRIRVRSASLGKRYRAYYMIETSIFGDPLVPEVRKAALESLDKALATYRGTLDVHWFDSLSYAYPGSTPQGLWDWHSYTMAARPESQQRFAQETGMPFDPQWLAMPGTINAVPDPRYLAWMSWVQKSLRPWFSQAAAVCAKHGMGSWLYWGDCHVGMEPYLGSLDGAIQELDLPVGDPLAARALVDFAGPVKRRMRVDWIFPETATSDKSAAQMLEKWARARRGLLVRPASGIYWAEFELVAAAPDPGIREDFSETLSEINDEFRLIGDRLAGSAAFAHPINVYVAHCWGKVYSWRGPQLLVHLSDLPVNVQFVSFAEIESQGVPTDASVLLLCGMPGTAWSGGRWWESGKVAAAIRRFVKRGGGLIAFQAPSHLERPQPHLELGDVLGVAPAGAAAEGPSTSRSPLAVNHWLAAEIKSLPTLRDTFPVRALQDSSVVYTLPSKKGAAPGVVASQCGKGRIVYFSGWSPDYSFGRLVRRAVFWAARRQADLPRLDVTGAEYLFIYAYPKERLLALSNSGGQTATATVRCDPRILGLTGRLRLVDVGTGKELWHGSPAQLGAGVPLESLPWCVRLIQVEGADSSAARDREPEPSSSQLGQPRASLRTWTDKTGKFRIEAEFVARTENRVTLRKPTGETISVPLDRLSEEDQAWLRKRLTSPPSP